MNTVYSADPDSFLTYVKKVWSHRAMILLLARRDLKIKYAQTALGLVWTVFQPLSGLLIFYFFFNRVINLPDIPDSGYAVFAFSGMTIWYFFSYIVYQSSTSLMTGQELAQKVFFPKIILPLSKVVVGAVDFGISMLLLFGLMLINGIYPNWQILALPIFVLLNIAVGLSVSIWLSALTIRFRDLHHIVPYIVNFGIWLTPVFFPATLIPKEYSFLLYLNPMAGIVEGFRWCIWEHADFHSQYFIGIGFSLVMLILGIRYFKQVEDEMIDVI